MPHSIRSILLGALPLCLLACGAGDVDALDSVTPGGQPPGGQAGSGGTAGQAGGGTAAQAGSAGQGTGGQPAVKPQGSDALLGAGDYHTCARLVTGVVKCWGSNGQGQLGLGDTKRRGDEPGEMGAVLPSVDLGSGTKALAVALGKGISCALLAGGQVKCWGLMMSPYVADWSAPTLALGGQPGQMGDALPFVDLGTGFAASGLSVDSLRAYAVTDQGTLEAFGYVNNGSAKVKLPSAIGLGPSPVVFAGDGCALLESGSIACWDTNPLDSPGDVLSTVDLGTGVKAVAMNRGLPRCAVVTDGRLKCWGSNFYGELGLGDITDRFSPQSMGDALPYVDLGAVAPVVRLARGGAHTCALFADGRVKCWGGGLFGQLGLGSTDSHGAHPEQMGDALPFVDLGSGVHAVDLVAGDNHTCALFDDGRIKCWGSNSGGQLGLGDTNHRGDNPGEMGDALPFVDLGALVGL